MKKYYMVLIITILYCLPFYSPSQINKNHYHLHYYSNSLTVENIALTIRIIESGNNYMVKQGISGEKGAYQFMPFTWVKLCNLYYKKKLPFTIYNQDLIAKKHIEYLLKNGYTTNEIASIWNSGSPNWENKKGINKYGAYYDVPKYVKKFEKSYSEIIKIRKN